MKFTNKNITGCRCIKSCASNFTNTHTPTPTPQHTYIHTSYISIHIYLPNSTTNMYLMLVHTQFLHPPPQSLNLPMSLNLLAFS